MARVPDTLYWRVRLWLGRMWRRYWPWYRDIEQELVDVMSEAIGREIDAAILDAVKGQ